MDNPPIWTNRRQKAFDKFMEALAAGESPPVPLELDVFSDKQLVELIEFHTGRKLEIFLGPPPPRPPPLPSPTRRPPPYPSRPPPPPLAVKEQEPMPPSPPSVRATLPMAPDWMSEDELHRAQAKAIINGELPPVRFSPCRCSICDHPIRPEAVMCSRCISRIEQAKPYVPAARPGSLQREKEIGLSLPGSVVPGYTRTPGCRRIGPHNPDWDYYGHPTK